VRCANDCYAYTLTVALVTTRHELEAREAQAHSSGRRGGADPADRTDGYGYSHWFDSGRLARPVVLHAGRLVGVPFLIRVWKGTVQPSVGFRGANAQPSRGGPVSSSRTTQSRLHDRYGDHVSTTQTSAPASAGGIVVDSLARSFGDVHAVRDMSFTAPAGSVTGLIGPNGSGKTTLMLMLASLLQPDAGTIRVGGVDPIADPAAVRAVLGWMPDALGSWDSLTVRSALETTGRLYRMSRSAAAERASVLLDLVGLDELASRPTRVLSRGQKQKLSLARSLVHDPQVLLLDEPASGLDPLARADLQMLVRRLAAEGKTILVSSHVLAELDEMADSAVYVDAGVTASTERIAEAKTSQRLWRIRAADAGSLDRALTAAGIPAEVRVTDRGETSVPIGGEADAAVLLARLVKAGVAISSFAPAVGDLEHTFLDLNGSKGGVR
jgi:ABC-2 type transport system ATP-binding protein